ncbi:hypothetical protein [Streptomyces sp. NPDC046182]|uniref:hypothetical protein n=1 Tax=Streptomyces sp. NPDC046182 TaxID=3154601 RepID=UPI0033D21160
MTAATYQYVDLSDASVVTTRALLTARDNITDTVAARAMMCIHGGAGFGANELAVLTADLPAPAPTRSEQDRKDLREWLAEWRYWLGGAVIMSGIWGARCAQTGELTYYWPVTPLGVWAAVLIAIAIWPRDTDGSDEGDGGRTVAR